MQKQNCEYFFMQQHVLNVRQTRKKNESSSRSKTICTNKNQLWIFCNTLWYSFNGDFRLLLWGFGLHVEHSRRILMLFYLWLCMLGNLSACGPNILVLAYCEILEENYSPVFSHPLNLAPQIIRKFFIFFR